MTPSHDTYTLLGSSLVIVALAFTFGYSSSNPHFLSFEAVLAASDSPDPTESKPPVPTCTPDAALIASLEAQLAATEALIPPAEDDWQTKWSIAYWSDFYVGAAQNVLTYKKQAAATALANSIAAQNAYAAAEDALIKAEQDLASRLAQKEILEGLLAANSYLTSQQQAQLNNLITNLIPAAEAARDTAETAKAAALTKAQDLEAISIQKTEERNQAQDAYDQALANQALAKQERDDAKKTLDDLLAAKKNLEDQLTAAVNACNPPLPPNLLSARRPLSQTLYASAVHGPTSGQVVMHALTSLLEPVINVINQTMAPLDRLMP